MAVKTVMKVKAICRVSFSWWRVSGAARAIGGQPTLSRGTLPTLYDFCVGFGLVGSYQRALTLKGTVQMSVSLRVSSWAKTLLATAALSAVVPGIGSFQNSANAEPPPMDKVVEGYEKVPCMDQTNDRGILNVWAKKEQSQLLVELPKNFASKRYFIALTVSSGDRYAGLQSGDFVVQWRQFGDRLAIIEPNLSIRATGEPEAQASVARLFTDQVMLDIPIAARSPTGGLLIDADDVLVGNAAKFFGGSVRISNQRLVALKQVKLFPQNLEIAFEVVGGNGQLQTLHYSISEVPDARAGFKPRAADERVGFFTTSFTDLSKYDDDTTRVRYINRWHLEKRDPKLKLSPPKEPIRFYIEHTTPVRYRRWVKQGIEYWNKAFEQVGFADAVVVEYQDAATGAHMEKDPEDVRYNFVRWLNNDVGTAIGPSRVHPETGQILDADIVLTDGWIRHYNMNFQDLMPKLAMEGMSPDTLAWLANNPSWDPRVRLTSPSNHARLQEQIARDAMRPMSGHTMASADPSMMGDDEYDGLYGRISQTNGYCLAGTGKQVDLTIARMGWMLAMLAEEGSPQQPGEKKEEEKKEEPKSESDKPAEAKPEDKKPEEKKPEEKKPEEKKPEDKKPEDIKPEEKIELLDGMPEWFVGPLLSELVSHEVGHTLGLRHNFKASSLFTLDQINSDEVRGKKPLAASVMDYIPINFRFDSGKLQGDYTMISVGPYDMWAIEYGYTLDDKKLPDILKRCSEPELQYGTDEDTTGPDPLARRYDFTRNPIDYAEEQMQLIRHYREKLLDRFVKDGDSWAKARKGYELTLSLQMRSVSMMANWIGGAEIRRDKKGDPNNRAPIAVVPAETQRKALQFVIDNTFADNAFGLTPELLERLGLDMWMDEGPGRAMSEEASWPIHDRVLGMQASAMTMLMNPSTLRRVYDNEVRLPSSQDTLTLPELLDRTRKAVWSELGQECLPNRTAREPMISSLRRNLQREHLERLLDLMLKKQDSSAAYKPISNLAMMQLRDLKPRSTTAWRPAAIRWTNTRVLT